MDERSHAAGLDDPAAEADQPVLSVIIACLNAASTLGTQLEALASQSCPVPWELLLCDNGSADAGLDIAESFRPRIPGLRIIDASARRGAGPARNLGVQQARGRWVAFCDADDEVADDWLAAMSRALAECRFVAGGFESHRLNKARVLRSRPMEQQVELQRSDFGAGLPHAGAGNMGMHRDDFLAVGGFNPEIQWLEDTDLSWRAQLAGVPLEFRPEVVVHVRLRQTFRSMYVQGRQYGLAQGMLEEHYGRPPSPPPARPARARRSPVVRVRATADWLVDHLVGGRLAWRVGWVVGHRSFRPSSSDEVPSPLPTTVP
jgi:cellulose synthase/poly-beta-1,6-N-acetylglucosamine synthase-like glycosyltransferase